MNASEHNIPYFGLNSARQGIVHVIGPELGFTLPGLTVVCGDSHTSTHGAFGALAFGIGTSEVEHVLATQVLVASRSKNMKVQVDGVLGPYVTSKDIILHTIGTIGTAGGTGMVIEFCGSAITALSMESRMALCNMTIEAGARAGLIAPDETTFAYLRGRPLVPADSLEWDAAVAYWSELYSDPDATFDRTVYISAESIIPMVSWGTSPEQVAPITSSVPYPEEFQDPAKSEACRRALAYMGLQSGFSLRDIRIDKVFIGSCTNGRLEDLRDAASVLRGRTISPEIKLALAVPGSTTVKRQAEDEGLDLVFKRAGFRWRESGCSMCVGLNEDALEPFERCASTSNRNFESRQGTSGRTHLMSPAMAAAAAVAGKIADVRQYPSLDVNSPPEGTATDVRMDGVKEEPNVEAEPVDEAPDLASAVIRKPFENFKSRTVLLTRSNVDTDAIMPKQFCKTLSRVGLGPGLFYNLRYYEDGKARPNFPLNDAEAQNAGILLVSGANFGCGSSREHAVWALQDFGFRAVIALSFADIFHNNACKNGLLPVKVPDATSLQNLVAEHEASRELEIDLAQQVIRDAQGSTICTFHIDDSQKNNILTGVDEITMTLERETDILEFECTRAKGQPWVDGWSQELREKGMQRAVRGSNVSHNEPDLSW